jgi:hypothetical protein
MPYPAPNHSLPLSPGNRASIRGLSLTFLFTNSGSNYLKESGREHVLHFMVVLFLYCLDEVVVDLQVLRCALLAFKVFEGSLAVA